MMQRSLGCSGALRCRCRGGQKSGKTNSEKGSKNVERRLFSHKVNRFRSSALMKAASAKNYCTLFGRFHLAAHNFDLTEDAQHVSTQNFPDIFCAVAAVK